MKGEIALKKRLVLKAVRVVAGFEGFEGCEVRNVKKKMMMRVEEKRRNSGERSLVGLFLFQTFAIEKDCVRYGS